MTYLSSFLLLQSFAKIAHASPEQLRRLPGFGQVKVRRIVDAFEKPFRNKATSAPLVTSTAGSEEANLESHDGGGADGVARKVKKGWTAALGEESGGGPPREAGCARWRIWAVALLRRQYRAG